jgi:hypothetical protein
VMIGFAQEGTNLLAKHVGVMANSWSFYCHWGNKYSSGTPAALGPSVRTGDKVTMKFSFDPTVKVYKNDALMGYINGILIEFITSNCD